jgi:hypothetical protein
MMMKRMKRMERMMIDKDVDKDPVESICNTYSRWNPEIMVFGNRQQ